MKTAAKKIRSVLRYAFHRLNGYIWLNKRRHVKVASECFFLTILHTRYEYTSHKKRRERVHNAEKNEENQLQNLKRI